MQPLFNGRFRQVSILGFYNNAQSGYNRTIPFGPSLTNNSLINFTDSDSEKLFVLSEFPTQGTANSNPKVLNPTFDFF
jgi:hypothetical protein